MFFEKEDLLITHYTWNTDDNNADYTGEPGRRIFDRFNGNQVLLIINYFGRSLGTLSITDGRKIEALINKQLPEGPRSEVAVFNWLRGIYLYHSN